MSERRANPPDDLGLAELGVPADDGCSGKLPRERAQHLGDLELLLNAHGAERARLNRDRVAMHVPKLTGAEEGSKGSTAPLAILTISDAGSRGERSFIHSLPAD